MDKFFSMFSIQEEDDFLLENPTFSITYPEFIIPQDLGIGPASLSSLHVQGTTLNNNNKGKRKCISNECPKDVLLKKIVHRDVERQRRQAMTNLYDSVRSVIPLELLKGKRSVSDHIHEAANYINYLQNNIEELEIRRDKLKKLLNEQNFKTGSCCKTLSVKVIVQSCTVGIEVSITGDFTIPLSSVLQMLLEEGLNVISSICTQVEGRSHYTILSEVMDVPGVNLDMLQKKLGFTINHSINSA